MTRRAWALAVGVAALLSWFGQFLITHWPTPSAVSATQEEGVRQTWRALGVLGQTLDVLDGGPLEVLASDKLLHMGLFAAVGGCALLWAILLRLSRRVQGALLLLLLVVGWLDEWSQQFVGRISDPLDIIANEVGVALGVATVLGARGLWRRHKRKRAMQLGK